MVKLSFLPPFLPLYTSRCSRVPRYAETLLLYIPGLSCAELLTTSKGKYLIAFEKSFSSEVMSVGFPLIKVDRVTNCISMEFKKVRKSYLRKV